MPRKRREKDWDINIIMKFSDTQLDHYRSLLHEEEEKIHEELLKLKQQSSDFGNDVDGFEEESDESEEIGNILSVKETLEERMRKIDKALEKIKEKKYVVCESCGKDIEEKLLAIDPESEFCKECKLKGEL